MKTLTFILFVAILLSQSTNSFSQACVSCSGNNATVAGNLTVDGETITFNAYQTCMRFWGDLSLISLEADDSQILFNADNCGLDLGSNDSNYIRLNGANQRILLEGANSYIKLSNASSYIQYANSTTGSGSAALGNNSPATTTSAPYTWLKFKSSDGSTVYIPAWK